MTRRTFTTARSKRRGFTMIEVTVTVVVIVVTAALLVPSVGRAKSQRKLRDFVPSIRRVFNLARSEAIDGQSTTYLQWNSAENKVEIMRRGSSTTSTTTSGNPTGSSQPLGSNSSDDSLVASIAVPDGVETNRFDLGDQSVDMGSWKLEFYADGTTTGGGVDFTLLGLESHASVTKSGVVEVADGPLDDPTLQRWSAGDFERRQ